MTIIFWFWIILVIGFLLMNLKWYLFKIGKSTWNFIFVDKDGNK